MLSAAVDVLQMPVIRVRLVLAVLIALVATVFIWQGFHLVAVWQGKGIDSAQVTMRTNNANTGNGIGLEQVAKLHLFGEKANNATSAPIAPTDIPSTTLKLVLVGAMTSSDTRKASALITTDKQTKRFFIGDSIASGVVLHEVHANSVIILRSGKMETLSFPRANELPNNVAPRRNNIKPGAPTFSPVTQQRERPVNTSPLRPLNKNIHWQNGSMSSPPNN
ncbi:MAG: type II secretion system protein N [Pseudomonadales bacterium]